MTVVLFLGPTLAAAEAESHLRARCLPPVKYGDLFRAVSLFKPRMVGIIDGYFSQVPAVWHKEILWAMKQGVRVFGAASMGALRAAELDRCGMVGIGNIYAAYRDGRFPPYDEVFEDDDEVAVVHGPAEIGYPAASEALVNIRATLAAAAREGVMDPSTRDHLVSRSKERFYAERSFAAVIGDASEAGLSRDQVHALEAWIENNRVNQKARDALELLQYMSAAADSPPMTVNFRFENTTLWDNATRELARLPALSSPVLDELRLLGGQYFELRDEVIDEVLQSDEGAPVETEGDSPESWFQKPLRARERKRFVRSAPAHWVEERMLARLVASGELEMLEQRAADKKRRLGPPKDRAADLSELQLLELLNWYFSGQLGQEMPADLDEYAAALGGLEVDELHDLVLKEYRYLHPES
ncbi:MAG: TfuA-like protein [Arenicellales bacterium]